MIKMSSFAMALSRWSWYVLYMRQDIGTQDPLHGDRSSACCARSTLLALCYYSLTSCLHHCQCAQSASMRSERAYEA